MLLLFLRRHLDGIIQPDLTDEASTVPPVVAVGIVTSMPYALSPQWLRRWKAGDCPAYPVTPKASSFSPPEQRQGSSRRPAHPGFYFTGQTAPYRVQPAWLPGNRLLRIHTASDAERRA